MTSILIVSFIGYFSLLAALYAFQRKLMYHPDPERAVPAQYRLFNASQLALPGHDNLLLHSWYQAPADGDGQVVLYFHGNAGAISGRSDKAERFADRGMGFLLPSYRYNAGNGGEPSEEALIKDGLSAYDWLKSQGYQDRQIILYGESLGSGIAVAVANNRKPAAVILEAPYSSIADVAQGRYWFMPVRWLVHDQFDSTERIGNVKAPILIVHGGLDRTIPVAYGRRLHAAAPEGSEYVELKDAGHIDLYDHGMADHVFQFTDKLLKVPAPAN